MMAKPVRAQELHYQMIQFLVFLSWSFLQKITGQDITVN